MIPMAFNDGIYFNNNTSSGTFDTDIRICYWSNGWSGYTPMSASNLSAKGFRLINTNGSYYWVLGKTDAQCSASKASGFDAKSFASGTINNPLGSMFCIWADYPGAETEASVISKTAATIAAFGARVKDLVTDTTDPVDPVDPVDPTSETIKLEVGKTATRTQKNVNNENNVNRDELNDAIATVTVDGTDADKSPAKYSSVSVRGSTLAGSNTSWTKTDYFYKINNTYYPVYAYRGWSNGYYYHYGYSTTDDSNNVTLIKSLIGSQTVNVYKMTSAPVDIPASTTITFVGVAPGTTYVTVGNVKYTIIVDYKLASINLTPNQTKTVDYDGILDTSELNTDVATVEVSGNGTNRKISVTGVAVGSTTFIVGGTKYTVTVTEEDLDNVTPLSVEYWITNGVCNDANGNASASISAATLGIASADGIDVTPDSLIPSQTIKVDGKRTVDYWHCRLLDKTKTNDSSSGTEEQTEKAGDDETRSGAAFTKIRYYGGTWSVFTAKNEWISVDASKHQLVAYYAEHIKVTDEVDSHASDWGKLGDGSASGSYLDPSAVNTLSFQVVYEDGTTNPSGTTADVLKSKTIGYGYWTNGRGIGTVILDESADFEIYKVTAETGAMTGSGDTWGSYTVSSFTWDNNELTVWEDSADNGQVILYNNPQVPETEGIYQNLMWDENYESILIRVYVRAKITEDSLRVHYIDRTNGVNDEFYNYNIAVKSGTYFDTSFGLNGGVLTGNTVTNIKNITQTVTTDLSKLTEVKAQYRYSKYTCVEATRSDDGKNVYLYYTFDNAVTYVVDFGLPVTIEPKDINTRLIGQNVNLTGVDVAGASSGTTTVNAGYGFTYTPNADFITSNGEKLTVTYQGTIPTTDGTDQAGDVSYQIYILPASNVLYEENFLTTASADWQEGTSSAPTAAQQTQKLDSGDTTPYNVFGTDGAYANAVGDTGVWKAGTTDSPLSTKKPTGLLTTSFYGNAFDLIGNCGVDTGRVVMIISPVDKNSGARTRILDIDTRYNNGTLNQVPLAHVVLDKDAEYKVEIMASGLDAKTVTPTSASAVAVMSAPSVSADELLLSVVRRYGLSMANVERVSVSDTFSAASVSTASVSAVSDAAMFAAESQAEPISYAKGTHVEIDSFRVYRTAAKSNAVAQNYPTAEQDITYWNILDVMKGQTITAYTENGDVTNYKVENYEAAGGPQNEIYLSSGQAISFKIADFDSIQVSLRAVTKESAQWATSKDGTPVVIKTNTEMYYEIKADGEGVFTIANRGETLLAIGNAKLPSNVTADNITSAGDIEQEVLLQSLRAAFGVSAVEPEPELFQPSTFDAKVSSMRLIRNKLVTIRISVSSDVSYVTVNGVKYWPGRLTRWQKTRYIQFHDTVGKYESKTYTIVAYDANGVASAPITVNG